MFYIHGGRYTFGSPMMFPVDFLVDNYSPAERSVVVVTVTYRLGTLGFLNLSPLLTKKTSAPKNVGMHG
jgi:carboxylesterase type B